MKPGPPVGLILAAGRSSRMGRDKALLEYAGSSFLAQLVAVFRQVLAPVSVVLGHHADQIRRCLPSADSELLIAVNQDYDRGMLSSMQTGLSRLPDLSSGVIFTLVDHPGLRADSLRAIVAAMVEHSPAVVIPRCAGRRGHPTAISAEVAAQILALPQGRSAKEVIRGRRAQTLFVDLDDPAVVRDIDRPEDYRALQEQRSAGSPPT